MTRGRVYTWTPDAARPGGGFAELSIVPLRVESVPHGPPRLRGRLVVVHNAGEVVVTGRRCTPDVVLIGDARPDDSGDFLFSPHRGGGRLDKDTVVDPDVRARYVEASHFGEVNVFYHLHRIASYVDAVLGTIGARPLPRVTALVNAHNAAAPINATGLRDGVAKGDRMVAFQGGHYRLPGKAIDVDEHRPIAPCGEIHLGPGRSLLAHGALAELTGQTYRANASHNPGIIYHEYGHHICRHTADLRVNALRPVYMQDNRKTALDEGTADYWAASMLDSPHIWAFHHGHDGDDVHPRSLVSPKTMADYDHSRSADAHANGTIWACALWDIRSKLVENEPDGACIADRLVLAALRTIGKVGESDLGCNPRRLRHLRTDFATGAAALLEADAELCGRQYAAVIRAAMERRGIHGAEAGALARVFSRVGTSASLVE